jgi:hypothetical protein
LIFFYSLKYLIFLIILLKKLIKFKDLKSSSTYIDIRVFKIANNYIQKIENIEENINLIEIDLKYNQVKITYFRFNK